MKKQQQQQQHKVYIRTNFEQQLYSEVGSKSTSEKYLGMRKS